MRDIHEEDPKKFRIVSFKFLEDFVIEVVHVDGTKKVIDFRKLKLKKWMKNLENLDYFNQVGINEIGNLEWPNGEDFHPGYFYYWEEYEKYYQ
ncbi:MAG: DUF2442 domain-containing protein [Candidatus Algichlamydia australiensis]|nr:DUF2442 domain-containing protein [Chlamydiales bacterium]